jgi:hypothetical protein
MLLLQAKQGGTLEAGFGVFYRREAGKELVDAG